MTRCRVAFWLIKILFLVSSWGFSIETTSNLPSKLILAIEHFNKKYFNSEVPTLSFNIEAEQRSAVDSYFNNLLNNVLTSLNNVKIIIEKNIDKPKRFDYYNIIMIDSMERFRKLDPAKNAQSQDYSEFYLIVLYTHNHNIFDEIQKIFDYCWRNFIMNVNIMVETEINVHQEVNMYTYKPFSENHCNKPLMMRINLDKELWNKPITELFSEKTLNFYGCNLTAAVWDTPPFLILPKNGKSKTFDGMEGKLLHIIAQKLNFSIDYKTPPNGEQRGLVMANGTLTGAIKMLYNKEANISLGSFRCTLQRSTTLSPSMTIHQTVQVLTILAIRQPYTTLEILALPFKLYLWVTIIIIFIMAILNIMCLNYFWRSISVKAFGNASSIELIMECISTALGQSIQRQRLSITFHRYFLSMWLILTLVLRSGYQGVLYDFLSKKKSIEPADSVMDLITRGYTLIVNLATRDSFSEFPAVRDGKIKVMVMNITDAGGFPLLEQFDDKLYVTGTPKDFLTDYVNRKKKFQTFHVLKETVFTQQLCIYFSKHSYLIKPFNNILSNIYDSGIGDYLAKQYFNDDFLKQKYQADDLHVQVPLKMSQLYGMFQIQCLLWGISFFVFLIEILLSNPKIIKIKK